MRFRNTTAVETEQGIGLPIAIFVITVLAAFAVNMGLLVEDNASGELNT